MNRIYRPAYIDYWKDNGDWYVNLLYNKENIEKELKENKTTYFFIQAENKNIGIFRCVYEIDTDYETDVNSIKIHRLYIDQTIQNKGIGKEIINWLIDDSIKKGYKKLWLEVMEKQLQARNFYKQLGFINVDKVIVDFPLLYDDYRGMYKMEKYLD
ncbi:MAG: GNAT family N-acetyltransferase [Flavobacteriaceae bacterium]